MPLFKIAREIDGPQASTDFLDFQVIITLATSGAAPLSNFIQQGQVVCADITSNLPGANTAGEMAVPVNAANAGVPIGVYQSTTTLTNASTTATSTAAIVVRRFGFGQVLVTGSTTNVLVGQTVTVKPGSSTPIGAQVLVAAEGLTPGAASWAVGSVVATTGLTTLSAVVSSSTGLQLVNAYITLG
jgi:hypothetical protein